MNSIQSSFSRYVDLRGYYGIGNLGTCIDTDSTGQIQLIEQDSYYDMRLRKDGKTLNTHRVAKPEEMKGRRTGLAGMPERARIHWSGFYENCLPLR
jgi:hypothetical protein